MVVVVLLLSFVFVLLDVFPVCFPPRAAAALSRHQVVRIFSLMFSVRFSFIEFFAPLFCARHSFWGLSVICYLHSYYLLIPYLTFFGRVSLVLGFLFHFFLAGYVFLGRFSTLTLTLSSVFIFFTLPYTI